MKNPLIVFLAIGLASCATPEETSVIAEEPKEKPKQKAVVSEPEPVVPISVDDGLRMPDMLALPNADQLRSVTHGNSGEATVITRPPSE